MASDDVKIDGLNISAMQRNMDKMQAIIIKQGKDIYKLKKAVSRKKEDPVHAVNDINDILMGKVKR